MVITFYTNKLFPIITNVGYFLFIYSITKTNIYAALSQRLLLWSILSYSEMKLDSIVLQLKTNIFWRWDSLSNYIYMIKLDSMLHTIILSTI